MLIFGHKLIKSDEFIFFQKDFDKEKINCFSFDEKKLLLAKTLNIKCAIYVKNINEAILCNALNIEFIISDDKKLSKKLSKIAQFYLFDTKTLFLANDLNAIKTVIKCKSDGLLLKNFIIDFKEFE
ncbi:hypothetical protein FMM54_08355 [Campylobacter sp. LR185c]|uniref:hypothetical protein n=1 Tax=Campylobacter sp. LR185c TaxID=2014525 RepID=UPI001238048E|nr:hypothetical protein [Campylobacter sp. LR185c]KAA6220571.1 hypothetical protein FMM54_08355 [Campylobacter sp. LR185c]KAA8604235.1 hypothetical protein CGP82_03335 [Campylobacter sp. LR185c]